MEGHEEEPKGAQGEPADAEQPAPIRQEDAGDGTRALEAFLEKRLYELFAQHEETMRAEQARGSEAGEGRVKELLAELAASKSEIESLRVERANLEKESLIKKQAQALGVENTELAYRAVRDDLVERDRGDWVAVVDGKDVRAAQYLTEFVRNNPELLPPRRSQGGGIPVMRPERNAGVDLEEIRPGMDPGTVKRVRDAIGRVIGQNRNGL